MRFLENMVSDMVKQSTGINAKRVIRKIGGKNILLAGGAAVLAGTLASKSQGQGGLGGLMGNLTGGQAMPGGQVGGGQASSMPHPGQTYAPPPPVPGQAMPVQAVPGQAVPGHAPPPPIPGQAPPPPIPGQAAAPPPIPSPATPQTPQQAPPPLPGGAATAPPPDATAGEEPALDPNVTYAVIRTMVAAALSDGFMAPEEKTSIQGRLAESGLDEDKTRQIHQDLVLPPSPAELAKMTDDLELRETLYRFAALVIITDQKVDDLERRWLDRLCEAFEIPAERKAALEAETLGAVQGDA